MNMLQKLLLLGKELRQFEKKMVRYKRDSIIRILFQTITSLFLILGATYCMAAKQPTASFFSTRLPVQPFPSELAWINTARPIQFGQLHGKFVLLDFWTLGCINCMHLIPELKKIEAAWPNDLVVIGVHSAKFAGEKNTKVITQAVLRYGIEHPVVNDANFAIWNNFGIQAWPSLVLIDPEGYAVWGHSGEITFDQLDEVLKPAIAYYRRLGLLNEQALTFQPESQRVAVTPLRFPGKILADVASGRLFIADSGHNRIVVTRLDGSLLETIGDGRRGQSDGDYAHAQFSSPQGMAINDETLYVADTENHLIRKIDLAKKRVETIAGTGRQSSEPPFTVSQDPKKIALNSPWALYIDGNELYIAMAGAHQIWKMPLSETAIGVYAGNGVEDIVDGPLAPHQPYQLGYSSFAQPSGLASDGVWLYVADAEGSSIRAVPLNRDKKDVRTVVGTAHLSQARLFTFGDIDGPASTAKLQHPLGIVFHEGKLYIIDTYNNKIKTIDPLNGDTQTLLGTGAADYSDNPPAFNNPSGLSYASGNLYVADTNNHAIRVIDLKDSNAVSTLNIPGLTPPASDKIRQ
jgi:thiol-disulfide isomerase/thioredoxin